MSATLTSRVLPDPAAEPTITVKRAAAVLGISARAAYYAADRGELPMLRVGKSIRIPTARFLAHCGLAEPDQSA